MEELKDLIAKNLVLFRKNAKLTQLELAEKLKYSDKNISKWERGESVPDVVVLKQLADLYQVKVDDFFLENIDKIKNKEEEQEVKIKTKTLNKKQLLILLLSVSLVWLTAIVAFSVFINIDMFAGKAWFCFIYAITISCIVSLVFTSLWCTNLMNAIIVSLLIWSAGLSFYLTADFSEKWAIFIVCIPIQVLDILWFIFRKINKNLTNKEILLKMQEKKRLKKEEKLKKLAKKKEEKENIEKLKLQKDNNVESQIEQSYKTTKIDEELTK